MHLREQHFGIAEGNAWAVDRSQGLSLEEHFARGIFPILHLRSQKFPEGESLHDLSSRAAQAIDECVMPHIWEAARSGWKGGHIALVSHGLCISEMVPALLRKAAKGDQAGGEYRGLMNTAWTRVTIDVKVRRASAWCCAMCLTGYKEWEGEPLEFSDDNPPPLVIRVTEFNRHEHLDKVVSSLSIFDTCPCCLQLSSVTPEGRDWQRFIRSQAARHTCILRWRQGRSQSIRIYARRRPERE